ncbi:MAG: adenylate/guanylate cyclase domain-containing protein [Polynucleobacter sp.]|nr:adenylate/guanylate cyclase domain-containing protein [Polynucleobacter sp.]
MADIVLQCVSAPIEGEKNDFPDPHDRARTEAAPETPTPEPFPPPPGNGLRLTVDEIAQPAYMLNYSFELVWFNTAAQKAIFGGIETLPATSDQRRVFRLLADRDSSEELMRFHVGLVKTRLSASQFEILCQGLAATSATRLQQYYSESSTETPRQMLHVPIVLPDQSKNGQLVEHTVYASFFREGIFVAAVSEGSDSISLMDFMARRDEMIRSLLKRRLPVLTHLAVLVADLQSSVRICSELPPEEYFELINEIWAAMGPIFRRYHGTYAKHVGDGMVYYFFPQPDSNYLSNALYCAQEVRREMQKISKAWQIRKNWHNELYLNTGITEGQEWLGTFQASTSFELVVLGDTINQAARISDFARHGAVWVTKSLVGKLAREDRAKLRYGVRRHNREGRDTFVPSSFSTVSSLAEGDSVKAAKHSDIATLPITEIVDIAETV